MTSNRREICISILATGLASSLLSHAAEPYPLRPVKLIVPYAAGGGSDALARLVANGLGSNVPGTFVVENTGGAGGSVGLGTLVRSAPDGYTLILLSTSHASNAAVMKLNYDVTKDIKPIGLIAAGPWILVANRTVGANDLGTLIKIAKANPGSVNYASSGQGSSTHLATELFAKRAGIQLTHIPYRSSGAGLTDLLTNRVQIMLASAPTVASYIRDGRLNALSVSTARRSKVLPDIPTLQEQGVPNYSEQLWHALAAPAGTPEVIVQKLSAALDKTLRSQEAATQFAREGLLPQWSSPEALKELIAADVKRWHETVRIASIKVE